jgi:hypothetical protein
MAVETVHGSIELAAEEPPGMRGFPLEHSIPGTGPFQLLRPLSPIAFGIPTGPLIHVGALDVGLSRELGRGREAPLLVEEGFDPFSRHNSDIKEEEGSLASCAVPLALRQAGSVRRLTRSWTTS